LTNFDFISVLGYKEIFWEMKVKTFLLEKRKRYYILSVTRKVATE